MHHNAGDVLWVMAVVALIRAKPKTNLYFYRPTLRGIASTLRLPPGVINHDVILAGIMSPLAH